MDTDFNRTINRGERRSRIRFALTFPIAVVLFIFISGKLADILAVVQQDLAILLDTGFVTGSFAQFVPSLIFLAVLLILAGLIIWKLFRMFGGRAGYVLAACLAVSLFSFCLPSTRIFYNFAWWFFSLVFLLAAAESALQLAVLPQEEKYRNPGLDMLCLLVLLGGRIAIEYLSGHTRQGFSPGAVAVYVILLAGYAFLQILSMRRQKNLQALKMTLSDSAKTGSLKMALGADGIKELLPYFSKQMNSGKSAAKLLILELIKGIEFKEKVPLVKSAFDSGPLEVRLNIIDQIFNWNLPYELLPYIVQKCLDDFCEYLMRGIFRNYCDIGEHRVLTPILERVEFINRNSLSANGRLMYGYVFENRKEDYARLIDILLKSDRKEDRLLASEIMVDFVGTEDAVNRNYLDRVMEGARLNPDELEEMIEMCAEYDDGLKYLKIELSNYYSYSFIKKICSYYEPTQIVKSFNNSAMPISIAMVLYAATRMDNSSLSMYYNNVGRLLSYLTDLSRESYKIRASGHPAGPLLLEEIKTLKLNITAILLDYVLLHAGYPKNCDMLAQLEQCIAERNLDELLQAFPEKVGQTLKEILTGDLPSDECSYHYGLLRVSDSNLLLENIYKYLGGEPLDSLITANIENLIALKSIPMFHELDVFTLQQIQKISVYREFNADEMIVNEGDEGDSLFVILNGKVGVYKNGKKINEIQSGSLFGEMAIIDRQKRSATIRTLENTSFLVILGDDFMRLLDRNSSISKSVIRTLAERMRKMLEG